MTEIEILFQNDELLVINKPAGLLVHEDGTDKGQATVVDWFVREVPSATSVGEPQYTEAGAMLRRSGVVHRLDADTSGVLVLAKTQESFQNLKQQFKDRVIKKEYRALAYGALADRWGTIDRPIGRSARDFRLRSAQRGAKGMLRDAVTDWECLKTGMYEGEKFSYLRLLPKTGRTHQLRVHLKAIDRPIVCDTLYAGARVRESSNLGLSQLALHAHTLSFTLLQGERVTVSAPIPEYIEAAAARIA